MLTSIQVDGGSQWQLKRFQKPRLRVPRKLRKLLRQNAPSPLSSWPSTKPSWRVLWPKAKSASIVRSREQSPWASSTGRATFSRRNCRQTCFPEQIATSGDSGCPSCSSWQVPPAAERQAHFQVTSSGAITSMQTLSLPCSMAVRESAFLSQSAKKLGLCARNSLQIT